METMRNMGWAQPKPPPQLSLLPLLYCASLVSCQLSGANFGKADIGKVRGKIEQVASAAAFLSRTDFGIYTRWERSHLDGCPCCGELYGDDDHW